MGYNYAEAFKKPVVEKLGETKLEDLLEPHDHATILVWARFLVEDPVFFAKLLAGVKIGIAAGLQVFKLEFHDGPKYATANFLLDAMKAARALGANPDPEPEA